MIYFARLTSGEGPIKIGCSDYPLARVKQFASDVKMAFVVLAQAPGDFTTENNLHHKFAEDRTDPPFEQVRDYPVGGPREWFSPSPRLIAYIEIVKRTGKIHLMDHERREQIFGQRYLSGETLQSIAVDFGMTRERVRQVLNQHGYPSNPKSRAKYLVAGISPC